MQLNCSRHHGQRTGFFFLRNRPFVAPCRVEAFTEILKMNRHFVKCRRRQPATRVQLVQAQDFSVWVQEIADPQEVPQAQACATKTEKPAWSSHWSKAGAESKGEKGSGCSANVSPLLEAPTPQVYIWSLQPTVDTFRPECRASDEANDESWAWTLNPAPLISADFFGSLSTRPAALSHRSRFPMQ